LTLRGRLFPFVLHLGALAPLAWLAFEGLSGRLSVNPIQDLTLRTGKAGLVLLVLSLAGSPLYRLLGWPGALLARKWLGRYAFLYAGLHLTIFLGLDYGLDWGLIQEAIIEKPYALMGLSAFLLLLPLALTSTRGWQRRLGRRWKILHRLVYPAALFAVLHYLWKVKADARQPLFFAGVVILLLLARLPHGRRALRTLRPRLARAMRRAPGASKTPLYSGVEQQPLREARPSYVKAGPRPSPR